MAVEQVYSVKDFRAVCNQILETAFAGVIVEGEVASFKVNQGKYVFFDLKDDEASVGCFMMKFALRFPLEDGMKVRVRALPKLTDKGRFSLTVQAVVPVGEGSLKKSFELLRKRLAAEGLFAAEKKRPLPEQIRKIGVISSTQAAGYADFCKILNERWGGLEVLTAHTQVQGMGAADQIIRALDYFNERAMVDVIAIIRGGGSADDLAVFNDEALVRAVAGSKIPVITGIGHEVDETLCDLASDVVASTPSNVAQLLTKDKRLVKQELRSDMERIKNLFNSRVDEMVAENSGEMAKIGREICARIASEQSELTGIVRALAELNPEKVLARGYALVKGAWRTGGEIEVVKQNEIAYAKIREIKERN